MLKFRSLLIVLISLAFVATACDKPEEEAGADETAAVEESADEASADEANPDEAKTEQAAEDDQAEELAMVDVPQEGKAFDPPVEKEQIPAGAWFCDMGTVEYASMQKGDGSCPECGMKLKQKAGENAAAEEGAADDHAGHNH